MRFSTYSILLRQGVIQKSTSDRVVTKSEVRSTKENNPKIWIAEKIADFKNRYPLRAEIMARDEFWAPRKRSDQEQVYGETVTQYRLSEKAVLGGQEVSVNSRQRHYNNIVASADSDLLPDFMANLFLRIRDFPEGNCHKLLIR
jgi:hypothetical protein